MSAATAVFQAGEVRLELGALRDAAGNLTPRELQVFLTVLERTLEAGTKTVRLRLREIAEEVGMRVDVACRVVKRLARKGFLLKRKTANKLFLGIRNLSGAKKMAKADGKDKAKTADGTKSRNGTEKTAKTVRSERTEKAVRTERTERSEKTEKAESEKTGKAYAAERKANGAETNGAEKARPENPGLTVQQVETGIQGDGKKNGGYFRSGNVELEFKKHYIEGGNLKPVISEFLRRFDPPAEIAKKKSWAPEEVIAADYMLQLIDEGRIGHLKDVRGYLLAVAKDIKKGGPPSDLVPFLERKRRREEAERRYREMLRKSALEREEFLRLDAELEKAAVEVFKNLSEKEQAIVRETVRKITPFRLSEELLYQRVIRWIKQVLQKIHSGRPEVLKDALSAFRAEVGLAKGG